MYKEFYQYVVKYNGGIVCKSQLFDTPYAAIRSFLDDMKNHNQNDVFKRIDSFDGGVCIINENPERIYNGKSYKCKIEMRLYVLKSEPCTLCGFTDNILAVEQKKMK